MDKNRNKFNKLYIQISPDIKSTSTCTCTNNL